MLATDEATAVPAADCTVVITDHRNVDYAAILNAAQMVVDTRNALRGMKSDKLIRL